jgi:hypothetical protein
LLVAALVAGVRFVVNGAGLFEPGMILRAALRA